jgi:hypothetical protein
LDGVSYAFFVFGWLGEVGLDWMGLGFKCGGKKNQLVVEKHWNREKIKSCRT